jgi:hypothetical protein
MAEGKKELKYCTPLIEYDRACPGRAMAENALFITAVSILHVFDIVLPPGANSPDINTFTPGLFS